MTELDVHVAELVSRASELDAADPLGHWRGEFHVPDPELAYLDGNSLGMPPRRTLERVAALMADEWARRSDHELGRLARSAATRRRSARSADRRRARRGRGARLGHRQRLPTRARRAPASPGP